MTTESRESGRNKIRLTGPKANNFSVPLLRDEIGQYIDGHAGLRSLDEPYAFVDDPSCDMKGKLVALVIGLIAIGVVFRGWRHAQETKAQLAHELAVHQTKRTVAQKAVTQLEEKEEYQQRLLLEPLAGPSSPTYSPEQLERVRLDTLVHRGELDWQYPALFQHLHLDATRLTAFKLLLIERNQALYDAKALAKKDGLASLTPSEVHTLNDAATAEIDARIASQLGPDVAKELRHYEQISEWDFLGFEGLLKARPAEERYALAEKLSTLLATEMPTLQEDRYCLGYMVPLSDSFMAKFRAVLTPTELSEVQSGERSVAIRRRLEEINRAAAERGELKLSKSSARIYPSRKN